MSECRECGSGLAPQLPNEEPREHCFRCEKMLREREEENQRLQELDDEAYIESVIETERNIANEEQKQTHYAPGNYSILEVKYVEVRELDSDVIDVTPADTVPVRRKK